jgi:endonuclease YncB( thermonuclease family)
VSTTVTFRDAGVHSRLTRALRRFPRDFGVTATRARREIAALAILIVCGLLAYDARAERWLEAQVVRTIDGDTIEVRSEGETIRIRLSGIDTPERGQPWYRRSKQALADRVAGREVRINAITTDRYGRTIGEVYAGDVCVGCELVRDGHAWVYRRFSRDPILLEIEAEARKTGRGLWGLPESERVPPWEWRERQRKRSRGPAAATSDPGTWRCGQRTTCGEMSSCAEARYHLETCGLTGIDGDGDGMPCESLCRER